MLLLVGFVNFILPFWVYYAFCEEKDGGLQDGNVAMMTLPTP